MAGVACAHMNPTVEAALIAAGTGAPPDPDYQGALNAMYAARTAAGDADDAFFEVVNRELAWQAPSDRTRRARIGRRARVALAWTWPPGRRRAHHSPSLRLQEDDGESAASHLPDSPGVLRLVK